MHGMVLADDTAWNIHQHFLRCGVAQLTEKDEEVLKHLTDISVSELAPEPDEDGDEIGGFKLIFHFSANPFFSHTELVRMSQSFLSPLHPL
jgi:hypothetical protein